MDQRHLPEGIPILQLKVTLRDVSPAVWRRIQVRADSTFWDLHVAIQDAMGWMDSHLHAFIVRPKRDSDHTMEVGVPDIEEPMYPPVLPGWKIPVWRFLNREGDAVPYEYDFGDGWEHEVHLEKVLAPETGMSYPRCLDGARACPPEDCGGPGGYEDLLRILSDHADPEHDSVRVWVGQDFDPDAFAPEEVFFDDPEQRLEDMLL